MSHIASKSRRLEARKATGVWSLRFRHSLDLSRDQVGQLFVITKQALWRPSHMVRWLEEASVRPRFRGLQHFSEGDFPRVEATGRKALHESGLLE